LEMADDFLEDAVAHLQLGCWGATGQKTGIRAGLRSKKVILLPPFSRISGA